MILSELIAKLGELYLSQGDVQVEVSDGNVSWQLDDFTTGAAMDWVFLVSQSLCADGREKHEQFKKMREEITYLRQERENLRRRVERFMAERCEKIPIWDAEDTTRPWSLDDLPKY